MRRFAAVVLTVLGLLALAGPAAAAYPDRNVTIIVPYPAGGPTDQTARLVAEFPSKKFGQNFIVENVTGGSTIIATNKLAKADAGRLHAAAAQSADFRERHAVQDLAVRHRKDLKTVIMINRIHWCGRTPGSPGELVQGPYGADEEAASERGAAGIRHHRAPDVATVRTGNRAQVRRHPYRGGRQP